MMMTIELSSSASLVIIRLLKRQSLASSIYARHLALTPSRPIAARLSDSRRFRVTQRGRPPPYYDFQPFTYTGRRRHTFSSANSSPREVGYRLLTSPRHSPLAQLRMPSRIATASDRIPSIIRAASRAHDSDMADGMQVSRMSPPRLLAVDARF